MTILNKAREIGNIMYNGNRVSMYPDFSPELQKKRARFGEAKCKLQQLKVKYALLYPARLRINAMGETVFLDNPERVEELIVAYKKKL